LKHDGTIVTLWMQISLRACVPHYHNLLGLISHSSVYTRGLKKQSRSLRH